MPNLLSLADPAGTAQDLLELFFAQSEKSEIWETALTMEAFGSHDCIPRLVEALDDANPHRRHAAARALGWISYAGPRAAKRLIRALTDKDQPHAVREAAAESLAYLHYPPAIPALISVLGEADVRLRFWAAFALRSQYRKKPRADPRAVAALEGVLDDRAVPPGNWWQVGREALASLAAIVPKYDALLREETARIFADSSASKEDRRWAECYGSE